MESSLETRQTSRNFLLTVAAEIPDEAVRVQFLETAAGLHGCTEGRNVFRPERDVAGVLVPHRRLQAREEMTPRPQFDAVAGALGVLRWLMQERPWSASDD